MARPGRRICLPGMLNLLVAGERYRITRKRGEHDHGQATSERPEASVHSVILREPRGANHEIARSARLAEILVLRHQINVLRRHSLLALEVAVPRWPANCAAGERRSSGRRPRMSEIGGEADSI
jgi:hypothetical protein